MAKKKVMFSLDEDNSDWLDSFSKESGVPKSTFVNVLLTMFRTGAEKPQNDAEVIRHAFISLAEDSESMAEILNSL